MPLCIAQSIVNCAIRTHAFVALFSGLSSPSLSSSPSLVGSSVVYQSGDTALLPCDVSVPVPSDADSDSANADELRLIMWYREDVKSPIYREERQLLSSKRRQHFLDLLLTLLNM